MRLTRLEFQNLLSYDLLDLSFDQVEQIGVVGNTGAGKSGLLDGIRFALWGSSRYPSPDDLIRKGESVMSSALEFELHGRQHRVWRQRDLHTKRGETSLTWTVDGENRSKHAVPETEAALQAELGLSEDALLAGPFMVQREIEETARDLMHLKPAGRKDLLVQLFGLAIYEAYGARAKEWALQSHAALDVLEHRVTELDATIGGELATRTALADATKARDAAAVVIDELTEQVMALREEAARLHERAARQEELDQRLADLNETVDTAQETLDKAIAQRPALEATLAATPALPPTNVLAAVQERVDEQEGVVASLAGVREKRGELMQEWRQAKVQAKVVDQVPCHGQGEYASCPLLAFAIEARDTLSGIEAAGRSSRDDVERLDAAEQHLATLRRDLIATSDQQRLFDVDQRARTDAEAAIRQMAQLASATEKTNAEIAAVNAERMRLAQDVARRQELSDQLGKEAIALENAKAVKAEADDQVLTASTRLNAITEAKARRAELEKDRAELAVRCDGLRLLSQAFHRDGIPTLILENGIPLIEERANEVLARMPGAWRVELLTQRQTKTAGVAETLDVQITAGGIEFMYVGLSGGERFRVDFALRMALATVLARRAGTTVETLWLDEGFGGQDREGIAALMEAIAAVADEFRLIVVVSHVREVTDALPKRLEIMKHEGVSKAEMAA